MTIAALIQQLTEQRKVVTDLRAKIEEEHQTGKVSANNLHLELSYAEDHLTELEVAKTALIGLRNEFAKAALTGIIANANGGDSFANEADAPEYAMRAYAFADAMLVESEKVSS